MKFKYFQHNSLLYIIICLLFSLSLSLSLPFSLVPSFYLSHFFRLSTYLLTRSTALDRRISSMHEKYIKKREKRIVKDCIKSLYYIFFLIDLI